MEGTYHFMFEYRRDGCPDRYLFSKMALLVLAPFCENFVDFYRNFQVRDSQNSVYVTCESQRKLIMYSPVKFHCIRKLLQLTATCVRNKLVGTENKQFGKLNTVKRPIKKFSSFLLRK